MSKKLTINLSVSKLLVSALLVSLLVATSWLLYDKFRPIDDGPIPAEIASQLDFTPIIISKESAEYKVAKYEYGSMEDGIKRLVFEVTLPGNKKATFTEETQPSQFYDVAEYRTKFLETKSEQTVITDIGVIHLSKPEKQNNRHIGLILEKGLMIFINPTTELTNEEWRSLGNVLTTQKTS